MLEYKVQKKLQVDYQHTVIQGLQTGDKEGDRRRTDNILLEEEGGNATTTHTTSTNRTSGERCCVRSGIERSRIKISANKKKKYEVKDSRNRSSN